MTHVKCRRTAAKGKGSGAEKLIPSAALTGWAVDIGNTRPMLRPKIVFFQSHKA